MRKDMLIRTRLTLPQVNMHDRKERLSNMDHVFAVRFRRLTPHVRCVLLVDDIYTTGATLRSAASVLKKAGVQQVWAVTIAR